MLSFSCLMIRMNSRPSSLSNYLHISQQRFSGPEETSDVSASNAELPAQAWSAGVDFKSLHHWQRRYGALMA